MRGGPNVMPCHRLELWSRPARAGGPAACRPASRRSPQQTRPRRGPAGPRHPRGSPRPSSPPAQGPGGTHTAGSCRAPGRPARAGPTSNVSRAACPPAPADPRAAPPSGQRSPNCAPAYAPGRKPTAPARTRTLHRPRPHPQQAARTRRSPTSSGMACAPATGPDVGKPIEPDTGASPGQRAFGTSPPVRHGQLAAWIARDQYRPAGNGPNGCPARINLTVFAFPRKYAKRGSGLRDAHHQPARNTAASGASADLGSTQDRPRTTL